MDDESIREIVAEIEPLLTGRSAGKIFRLGPARLVIDFGLRDRGYLFISAEPAQPRVYLIKRRVRDLEQQGLPLSQFELTMKKEFANTKLNSISKDQNDRILRFRFAGEDELGSPKERTLVAQLTGRSANLFLVDAADTIIQAARKTTNTGQQIADTYQKPSKANPSASRKTESDLLKQIRAKKFPSPSEAADAYFTFLLSKKDFAARAATARAELRKKITQQQKLLKQLEADLKSHENAEQHKRLGDILLANLSTAQRDGNCLTLIDYFADDAPSIEIELDESMSLPEEAERQFALYSRSKRAVTQIKARIGAVRRQLGKLESEQESLERIIAESEPRAVASGSLLIPPASSALSEPRAVVSGQSSSAERTFESSPALQRWEHTFPFSAEAREAGERVSAGGSRSHSQKVPGTRRYVSADGFEILVGRTSRDNDSLTFKVAKPNDLWLHAADYGGSHVVVRNSTRKEIPHRTLIEAAQLAAQFSQARKDPKVDVHYTERKFVSKPKGAKPGLVRLTRFKNITVTPKEAGTRS